MSLAVEPDRYAVCGDGVEDKNGKEPESTGLKAPCTDSPRVKINSVARLGSFVDQ